VNEYLFQHKDKSRFYKQYQKTEEDLKKAGLDWGDLEEIGLEYLKVKDGVAPAKPDTPQLLRSG